MSSKYMSCIGSTEISTKGRVKDVSNRSYRLTLQVNADHRKQKMEREATQDILNRYLGGQGYSGGTKPFIEEAYDSDPLMDLLNFSISSKRTSPTKSPFKSNESPLKKLSQRSRGSPTKLPFASPERILQQPRRAEDMDIDRLSLEDFETEAAFQIQAGDNQAYGYLPGTKYSLFISNSAMKLRRALQAEQDENKRLAQKVVQLESRVSEAADLLKNHNALLQQLRELQERNEVLEVELQDQKLNLQKSPLSQENALLRLKLVKYKTLYEKELEDKKNSDSSAPTKSPLADGRENNRSEKTPLPSPIRKAVSKDLEGLLEKLASLACLFQALGDENVVNEKRVHHASCTENSRQSSPDHANQEEGNEAIAAKRKNHEPARVSTSIETPQTSFATQIENVALVMDQVRGEIHNINATLQQRHHNKHFNQNLAENRPSSDKSNCSACSNAASRLSTRPNSSSTPHNEKDGNDVTRNLMGKYNWNRTI